MENNRPSKVSLKEKIIGLNVLMIVIFVLIIFFVILPSSKEIDSIQTNIQDQYLELEKKYLKGQSLKKLNENLNKIEPQSKKLDNIFIQSDNQLNFITMLEGIAKENQLTQKVDLGTPINLVSYKKIPLQINVQGNFYKQMAYLEKLESLEYYININSIELTPLSTLNGQNSESGSDEKTNMQLSVDTFWK